MEVLVTGDLELKVGATFTVTLELRVKGLDTVTLELKVGESGGPDLGWL